MAAQVLTFFVDTFAGGVLSRLFGRGQGPARAVILNVDPTGRAFFTPRPGGNKALRWMWTQVGNKYSPAMTEYIRTGKVPTAAEFPGNFDVYRVALDDIRTQLGFYERGVSAFQGLQAEGGYAVSPPGEEFFMPGRKDIPPGGFAALAQQTPAGQLQQYGRAGAPRVARARPSRAAPGGRARPYFARKKRAAMRKGPVRRFKRRRTKARGLVKGSAEAKRYMARLRGMQKKGRRRRRRR